MTLQETVGRPAEEVFDYAPQPRNRPEWQGSLKEVRGAPAEPSQGASWTDVMAGSFGNATVEIVGFERPTLYEERVSSALGDGTGTVNLQESGDTTTLVVTADLDP